MRSRKFMLLFALIMTFSGCNSIAGPQVEGYVVEIDEGHFLVTAYDSKRGKLIPQLLELIETLKASGLAPIVTLARTLANWDEAIVCMWRFSKSNGIIPRPRELPSKDETHTEACLRLQKLRQLSLESHRGVRLKIEQSPIFGGDPPPILEFEFESQLTAI